MAGSGAVVNTAKAERWLAKPANRIRMARMTDNWKWMQSEAGKIGLTAGELMRKAK